MDTEKIGRFIACRRKTVGLTQQQLADELGITNKAVSKWETGQGMPDVTALPLLASVLSVTVDELLCGEKVENHTANSGESTYEVNKVIFWFRAAAGLSVFFALAGVITPFIMFNETSAAGALLFGCWWEIISFAVFITFYSRMNNVAGAYNKSAETKIYPDKTGNQFLKFVLWLWLAVPSGFIVHIVCQLFSYQSAAVETALTLAAALLEGIIVRFRFLGKKKQKNRHESTRIK